MKILLGLLAMCTTTFASHSSDIGYFYSYHHETGYKYKVQGVTIEYEIGKNVGLKAGGKVWYSHDDGYPMIKTRGNLSYYIPVGPVELIPFFSTQTLNHIVHKQDSSTLAIARNYTGVGIGFKGDYDQFIGTLKFGHYFGLTNYEIYRENKMFVGNEYPKSNLGFASSSIGYTIDDQLIVKVRGDIEKSYDDDELTWSSEITLSVLF